MPNETANDPPPTPTRSSPRTPAPPITALVLCRGCDAVAEQAAPPGWHVDDPPAGRRPFYRLGTCPECLGRREA
jgi:hypothetical protein